MVHHCVHLAIACDHLRDIHKICSSSHHAAASAFRYAKEFFAVLVDAGFIVGVHVAGPEGCRKLFVAFVGCGDGERTWSVYVDKHMVRHFLHRDIIVAGDLPIGTGNAFTMCSDVVAIQGFVHCQCNGGTYWHVHVVVQIVWTVLSIAVFFHVEPVELVARGK